MDGSPEQAKAIATRERENARRETDEQKLFGAYLRKQRKVGKLNYLWPRSDKATTIQVGHWDFTVWLSSGRELRMEFKAPGGKCTPEQEETIALMARLGHPVLIITTAEQAKRIVELAMAVSVNAHSLYEHTSKDID